jgi:hypothetical protein
MSRYTAVTSQQGYKVREIIKRTSRKRKEDDRYAWTEFRDLGVNLWSNSKIPDWGIKSTPA